MKLMHLIGNDFPRVLGIVALLSFAAAAGADTYDLVYGAVTEGSSLAEAGVGAGKVEIISLTVSDGVEGGSSSSSSYSVEPIMAAAGMTIPVHLSSFAVE